jgi:ankyrin repeat protein
MKTTLSVDHFLTIFFDDNKNESALHWAATWPNIPVPLFQAILDKTANANAKGDRGSTALDFASKY